MITVTVLMPQPAVVCCEQLPAVEVSSSSSVVVEQAEYYRGSYSVTPGPTAVTLQTAAKYLEQNVVVNPIPSNYGLITYNGYELTVS